MPVSISFDISNGTTDDFARIRMNFQRLWWEPVGQSSWRYPRLERRDQPEDFFNHVLPALEYLKTLAIERGGNISRYCLHIDSISDWRDGDEPVGTPILAADQLTLSVPGGLDGPKLSEAKLRRFIARKENI